MWDKLMQDLDGLYEEMVHIRRYLHQYPELSFHETKTAKYIASFYEELGMPYQSQVGGNGVIAKLEGGKPGKTVALRADFDALPIQDAKDAPYKSTVPGVMHACGHDGHTAALLCLAKALIPYKDDIPGTVVFLHQHAEEITPGGAKPMIEAGALNGVDAVFGTHLWINTPVGAVETAPESFFAGADAFEITIQGKGGHGAQPHQTKDAILIGSQLVTSLQQIVSRKIDPLNSAVVTVGTFEAGKAFNVIADTATLKGTVRTFNQEIQETVIQEMEKHIKGACVAHDASYEFYYTRGYPPLVNHPREADLVLNAAANTPGIERAEYVSPVMTGEDFSYYMLERPGAFYFTGAQKEGHIYPHHHPKFDFDERALPLSAKTLFQSYLAYQNQH
ncbi:amidohydrolase [Pontibacillus yanchengensis]|uniref:Amidohydrolase n=2 Tax=Pontibacillus yanchengensis TaxID=462910 RepID=A0ACC7VD75_9BACI|nr:amidohydrolase [Pontibacillus yanchengensis]MYL32351.1 amidohydrolase [Pontibacillus yanchengensis]MYL52931.1 amidohydrolase [Pontibacillus yanchengensis]